MREIRIHTQSFCHCVRRPLNCSTMMTMAKTNEWAVRVPGVPPGGCWRPFLGSGKAQQSSRLLSRTVTQPASRYCIADDETSFGPRLTGWLTPLGRSWWHTVAASGWLFMAQRQPQQTVSHLVNGLLARSLVEEAAAEEEDELKGGRPTDFSCSLSKATST